MSAKDWMDDGDYDPAPKRLVRVPVEDELWRTEDGRILMVAYMSEDHVRNALRHVIWRSRYAKLLKDLIAIESMSDEDLDWMEICNS